MQCRDAEFYLRLRRPGSDEFDPELTAALDRHLAGCPACAAAARAVGGFDAAVVTAMRAVPVPDGLRDRLFTATAVRRGALLRRKTYSYAAAAASVLVVAGLAAGWYSASRPRPDLADMLVRADDLRGPRGGERAVARFLQAERLPDLPVRFDLDLVVHTGSEKVQGRDVPVIVLRDRTGTGWAKVYAFRGTAFDVKGVRDEQASHCVATVYENKAGVTYVVVHTGFDLSPFLPGGGPVAGPA